MRITVVNIDEETLWNGVKVRQIKSGKIMEIFVIPENKTISECVKDGSFNLDKHIDYKTVMLNKHLFELVKED